MEAPGCERTLLRGSEIEVFKLVSEGSSREQWAQWLRVPLEHAAAEGNHDLVTALLGAGADGGVGWRGLDGRTLLAAAVQGGNKEAVQALLRDGAMAEVDVQFGDEFRTALQLAAFEGAEAAARSLLLAGADPNLTDAYERAAIHLAAEEGHHRMIGELVQHGALVNPRDDAGRSPLHLATSMGHTLAVSTLLESGADSNVRNFRDETPLYTAAESYVVYDSDDDAEQLVVVGADTNLLCCDSQEGDQDLQQPVPFEATKRRSLLEMVNLLLQHGADASAVDSEGGGILHHHFLFGYPREGPEDRSAVIRALLKAGAPVNARIASEGKYSDGWTPLHCAMGQGVANYTIMPLLEERANVNCQDATGRTPLHIACLVGNVAGAEVLLRWGADETTINGEGETAADSIRIPDSVNPVIHANCEFLRRMLARAPADRAWRRRGWLVLCRYYPNRARLRPHDIGCPEADGEAKISSSHATGSPVKVKGRMGAEGMAGGGGAVAVEEGAAAEGMMGWQTLMAKVVGLDVEGVFRTVVGFL